MFCQICKKVMHCTSFSSNDCSDSSGCSDDEPDFKFMSFENEEKKFCDNDQIDNRLTELCI